MHWLVIIVITSALKALTISTKASGKMLLSLLQRKILFEIEVGVFFFYSKMSTGTKDRFQAKQTFEMSVVMISQTLHGGSALQGIF